MTMKTAEWWALSVALTATALLGVGALAQEPRSIRVPEGNGRPILIDGIFTPGEWDDALKVDIARNIQLLLKKGAGFVFVGVRFTEFDAHGHHGSVDLFISPDGKSIRQLHGGAQLGERLLDDTPGLDDDPGFEWGNTSGWYANEDRWSERKIAVLMKEGKSRQEAQRESFYKSDGFEFQIRQSKFGSDAWFMRLRASVPPELAKAFFPAGTDTTSTAGWFRLLFK